MDKRIAVIGIVISSQEQAVNKVNEILSKYALNIVGRMGVPKPEKGFSVIALIVEGTTDEIGALTGKLGSVKGVKVKSAVTS